MADDIKTGGPRKLPEGAREAMERLNAEAGPLNIWLRTQANSPAQRPWFRETGLEVGGQIAAGRVGSGQLKAQPHRWRWSEISPYLQKIAGIAAEADVPPIEFADRQQFLLTNPGLGGRLQVANSIRCAVSIYNAGDQAPVHLHSPNASRTILSKKGGYTMVEGERCEAARGDLILTPNGTWHDHGNDAGEPVIWMDVLDWPLLEFLDCIWLDDVFRGEDGDSPRSQKTAHTSGHSGRLYGHGGLVPSFAPAQRGIGRDTSPLIHYRGDAVRAALDGLRGEAGDPYEGISLRFTNPVTGGPVFPTMDYGAQLLRPGEETRFKRETSSTLYVVLEGSGFTEVAGQRFDWNENDIFVVPNFLWRRHVNSSRSNDAVLYSVSDRALMERIGQYRAQGRRAADGEVEALG
jgi:gentisate 1,2-dioxygenase